MATFITTIRFTQQGMANIQDTCRRATAVKAAARKLGVKITAIYWTMGRYDGLLIFEAPDEETATAAMLHLASQGSIRTQTARAFDAGEIAQAALDTGFTEIAVRAKAAALVARLPLLHRDPFDRLLVAQAIVEPAALYTADQQLVPYSDLVRRVGRT